MIERGFQYQESKHKSRIITLNKESELRIKTSFETNFYVQVEEGTAEISGMEMTKYFYYKLPKVLSIPIYTWGGCKIKIVAPNHYTLSNSGAVASFSGKEVHWYEKTWQPNEENPHYMQANIFGLLETLRQHAQVQKQIGPKILIVGSPASGKSELARTFLNYSVKIGWPTAFVELDPEHPETSVPGMLTASVVSGEYLSVNSLLTTVRRQRDQQTGILCSFQLSEPREFRHLYFADRTLVQRAGQAIYRGPREVQCSLETEAILLLRN